MKVHHRVGRAIQAPKPGKVYGAVVEGLELNGKSISVVWGIFARKLRRKKKKIAAGKGKVK